MARGGGLDRPGWLSLQAQQIALTPNYLNYIWQADQSADKATVAQNLRKLVVMRPYLPEYLPPQTILLRAKWNYSLNYKIFPLCDREMPSAR